jgi:predicted RNA-binding Zn-ribbon protein involved in translation (DUF1610 family)
MARHRSGEYFTLDDAIEQGHIVRVRCGSCRRAANFRPGDLATIYGGGRSALEPLFPCGDCGTTEFVRATTYYPAIVDFGEIAERDRFHHVRGEDFAF